MKYTNNIVLCFPNSWIQSKPSQISENSFCMIDFYEHYINLFTSKFYTFSNKKLTKLIKNFKFGKFWKDQVQILISEFQTLELFLQNLFEFIKFSKNGELVFLKGSFSMGYFLKGYFLMLSFLKGYFLKGYFLMGSFLMGFFLKGSFLKGYFLKGSLKGPINKGSL